MDAFTAYSLLAWDSFRTSLLITFGYEKIFWFLLATNQYPPFFIWLATVVPGVAGSTVNWGFGKLLLRFLGKSNSAAKHDRLLDTTTRFFNKHGVWFLLFAWVDLIGNFLTFIAGCLNVKLWKFLLLVTLGKGIYYLYVVNNPDLFLSY